MDIKSNSYFGIKDLYIAAYLYSTNKVQLIRRERQSNGDIIFFFSPIEIVHALMEKYWNLSAYRVQPKLFVGAIKDLKEMILTT